MLFRAGGRIFGVGIGAVRRVVEEATITKIPRMPPGVAGAILFEGQVAPVFQVVIPGETGIDKIILIMQHESNIMGLAIESVLRVIGPDEGELKKGETSGNLDGKPFNLITPKDFIPLGLGCSRGGENA
jgi:chemotaxis signal transduction protein